MRRYTISLMLAILVIAVPRVTFADAGTLDFKALMQKCADFKFQGDAPFSHYDPAKADLNKNGLLDAAEFGRIAAICADASAPQHEAVHEAFKKNETQLTADLGGLAGALLPTLKSVLAGYATLGDGDYSREPDKFVGSWGHVAETMKGIKDFGSKWAEGAPDKAKYVLNAFPAKERLTKENAKPEELAPVEKPAAPAAQ